MTGFIRTTFLPDRLNPSFLPSGRQTRPDRSSHRKRDHLVGARSSRPHPNPIMEKYYPYPTIIQHRKRNPVPYSNFAQFHQPNVLLFVLPYNLILMRVAYRARRGFPFRECIPRMKPAAKPAACKSPLASSLPALLGLLLALALALWPVSCEPWRCARLPSATAGTPTRPRTYPLFRPTPSRNGLSGKSFPETCPPRRWRTRSTTACETTTWTPGSQRSRQSTERGQEDA